MKKIQAKEQGQILVLLILVFIGIIAFAALAMDGGMIFSDRRYSQNAADAASLTGATKAGEYFNSYVSGTGEPILNSNFTCDGAYIPQAKNIALDESEASAAQNNFSIAKGDTSAESHVEVTCVDNGSDAPPYDKYLAVKVQITNQTTSNFAHLFYPGPLKGTVEAVTKLYPGQPFAGGNAIVSLSKECGENTGGMTFSGTGNSDEKAVITGGGIHSNSCLEANGLPDIEADNITFVFEKVDKCPECFSPTPSPKAEVLDVPAFDPPAECVGATGGSKLTGNKNDGVFVGPGIYSEIAVNNGYLDLNPGLYCITGNKGIKITGGDVHGDGVTFYVMKGGITINGATTVNLTSPPNDGITPTSSFLFWMADDNHSAIAIEGNEESTYEGTIFGRWNTIDMGGNSDTWGASTQIIGYDVKVHGTGIITIDYKDSDKFNYPPNLDLYR